MVGTAECSGGRERLISLCEKKNTYLPKRSLGTGDCTFQIMRTSDEIFGNRYAFLLIQYLCTFYIKDISKQSEYFAGKLYSK